MEERQFGRCAETYYVQPTTYDIKMDYCYIQPTMYDNIAPNTCNATPPGMCDNMENEYMEQGVYDGIQPDICNHQSYAIDYSLKGKHKPYSYNQHRDIFNTMTFRNIQDQMKCEKSLDCSENYLGSCNHHEDDEWDAEECKYSEAMDLSVTTNAKTKSDVLPSCRFTDSAIQCNILSDNMAQDAVIKIPAVKEEPYWTQSANCGYEDNATDTSCKLASQIDQVEQSYNRYDDGTPWHQPATVHHQQVSPLMTVECAHSRHGSNYTYTGSVMVIPGSPMVSSDSPMVRTGSPMASSDSPMVRTDSPMVSNYNLGMTHAGRPRVNKSGSPIMINTGSPGVNNAGIPRMNNAGSPGMNNAGGPGMNNVDSPGMNNADIPRVNNAGSPGMNNAGSHGINNAGSPGMNNADISRMNNAGGSGISNDNPIVNNAGSPGMNNAGSPRVNAGSCGTVVNCSIPRKHKCESCDYQTDNRSHLRRHVISVHSTCKPYLCYVCGKEFTRTEKIKSHFIKMHPNVDYNSAMIKKSVEISRTASRSSFCGKIAVSPHASSSPVTKETRSNDGDDFSDDIVTRIHTEVIVGETEKIKRSRRVICTVCMYIGKDSWHLRRHMSDVHDEKKEFQCHSCVYATSRKHRLISHMKGHGELMCFYCSFRSTDLDNYMLHLKMCTKRYRSANYVCEVCPKTLPSQKSLDIHREKIHNVLYYKCEKCGYKTQILDEYKAHEQVHEDDSVDHYCQLCNENFQTNADLHCHMKTAHYAKVDKNSYKCTVCGFHTTYRAVMKNHMRLHTGELFECQVPECDFKAALKRYVNVHMQVHHGNTQHHVCPVCSKVFHYRDNYAKHMKIHNKEYSCPLCGSAFAHNQQLKQHVQKCELKAKQALEPCTLDKLGKNDPDKIHACDFDLCNYRTKYKNALKRHIDTQHLVSRSFVCTICLKTFKHQENLSKHVKIHNKEERCPVCKRLFALRSQLRQHTVDKHGLEYDSLELEQEDELSHTQHIALTNKTAMDYTYIKTLLKPPHHASQPLPQNCFT